MTSSDNGRLVFGLVVAPPGATSATGFDELASWVAEHVGVTFAARPAATYKALATSIRDGSSDVAWLPPVVYAWLAEAVTPFGSIVREGKTSYSAALVVRDDSALRTTADLAGVRAAWVDPWSAAGYVVPLIELARAGISPVAAFRSQTFLGTHRDALRSLERGDCDVVGTYCRRSEGDDAAVEGAWSELPDLRVRVLATFGAIPPDVLAARRNLAVRDYERARDALRKTFADPEGRRLARAVFGGDELREGIEPGHDALRLAYESALATGLFD